MSTDLLTLRAQVRRRLHLSANDPQFPDPVVDRNINMAVGDVGGAQPNGWWFQQVEVDLQNLTGLPALEFPLTLMAPNDFRYIQKVSAVFASMDGVYWLPVDQRERTDGVRLAGGMPAATGGLPGVWSVRYVGGQSSGYSSQLSLVFQPGLPAGAWVRCLVTVGPADLTLSTDTLGTFPDFFAGAIVETACTKLARMKRQVGANTARRRAATVQTAAQTAAAGWVRALRIAIDKPYAGAGYGPLSTLADATFAAAGGGGGGTPVVPPSIGPHYGSYSDGYGMGSTPTPDHYGGYLDGYETPLSSDQYGGYADGY